MITERDAVLVREGWTRRFASAPPRLDEMVELYRSIGLEVLLEPVESDGLADECHGCALSLGPSKTIWTRPATRTDSQGGGA